MAATKPLPPKRPPTQRLTRLLEDVRGQKPDRVDREAGVIYGVRVLGLSSPSWKRRYTPACLTEAVRLYDGAKVKIDHPDRAALTKTRSTRETFGWLEKPRIGPDGAIFADLHILNPKSELAESVFNAAERNPKLFGLSHNAESDGKDGRDADGTQVINHIARLHSVDLVDDPSTNTSLFEGRRMTTTIKELIEGNAAIKPKRKARLLEMGPDMGDAYTQPMDDPGATPQAPTDMVPEPKNARALLADVLALLLASGDPGDHALGEQLMSILKPADSGSSMSGPGTPPPPVVADEEEETPLEEDDEEEEAPPVVKTKKEAKKPATPAPAVVLTEADAKGLCLVAGVKETPQVLALMTGKTLTEGRAVLELAKGVGNGKPLTTPRSSPQGSRLTEGKAPATAEEQATRLLR